MKNLIIFILFALLSSSLLLAQTEAPPASAPVAEEAPVTEEAAPPADLPPPVEPMPFAPPMDESGGMQAPMLNDESAPAMQLNQDYIYESAGRRDPFRAYGQSQNTQMPSMPKEDGEKATPEPTDPLQMYDISQFKLVGIIWQVKKPKAVVKDPVGKMHMIYRDTKIGRNNGFVASIREGEVLVVEPTIGENGMPSAITRSMALKK